MASFSASWLTLREPADARARSERVTRAVADALPRERVIRALDLAAGTGSNVRYLTPFLRAPYDWLLADHDPALLAVARDRLGPGTSTRVVDLSNADGQRTLFAGRDLITASALLDLVSEAWLGAILTHCRQVDAHVLFALNYDGRTVCEPADRDDEAVRGLVGQHQRTDKGFGPALGPAASDVLARALANLGYAVVRERSDWILGADEGPLQQGLIDGWADAAIDLAPGERSRLRAWQARRTAHVAVGRSRIVVGHEDVAGINV